MAVTFIDYKENKGFYIHEDFMQLAFIFIYAELRIPNKYNFINKEDLISDCESKVNGVHSGYFVLSWEKDLVGESEEQLMIELLQSIINELNSKGELIKAFELESMETEDTHWKRIMDKPIPVKELIRIFNALIEMLNDDWNSTNYNMDIDW